MTTDLKLVALGTVASLIAAWFCYSLGYDKAKAEGELALEQLKLAQAQAVIDAQNKVKSEYEVQIQNLNAALASARSDSAERLRQLNEFRGANADLATCRRQRDQLSRLAVEGESLLREADAYLGSLVQ
ncbi:MAG TPA: hypothetical protein IAC45_02890 [Candidatus Aphodousia faecavium]|nr:hypothetical protein [Candidatus Aphodousia faecavium]